MQTGYLTVHSETQKPHCGTLFEVPDNSLGVKRGNYWYGVRGNGHSDQAPATIDCCDRTNHIYIYVRFQLPLETIVMCQQNLIGTFFPDSPHAFANSNYLRQNPEYELWHHNCVYFAKTVAEYCGLRTGGCVVDPTQLVLALKLNNSSQMFNDRPYPWIQGATCCPYCPTTGNACVI